MGNVIQIVIESQIGVFRDWEIHFAFFSYLFNTVRRERFYEITS